MSLWNAVDFGSADDTINLGSPNKGELKTLYDIHTISNIGPSNQDQGDLRSNPRTVRSAVTNSRVVVAIERSIIIYSNECRGLEAIANFDSDVECLSLSEDGDFLLVGCSDGFLRVMFVPLNKSFFSQRLLQQNSDLSRTFSSVTFTPIDKSSGSASILVFTQSGTVFQFKNILLSDLRNAVNEGNDVKIQEILLEVSKFKVNIDCNDGFLFTNFEKELFLLTMGEQNNILSMPEMDIMDSFYKESLSGRSLMKGKVMRNCRYGIFLDDSNIIHILCMKTFMIIKTWKQFKVLDFTLLETVDYESCVCLDVKLVVVVESGENRHLQFHSFPSLKLLFSANISTLFHLVDVPANQDILFLEGVFDESDAEHVSSIGVKEISEAMPEARLSRLLNKRKFDDALTFAKNFGLDEEVVYRTKVNYLFEQLQLQYELATFSDEITSVKKELLKCLDKISDIDTVANCCINASLPTLSDTVEMLLYVKDKINKCKSVDENLKSLILDRLKKIETFDSLFGSEQFRTTWKTFIDTNLLTELLKFLSQGKMHLVSILWGRHQCDLLQSMTIEHVVTILDSINISMHFTVFHKWLTVSFLPVVLQEIPQCLESVVSWVVSRCTMMEIADNAAWPHNAIEFAEGLDNICQEICSKETLSSVNLQLELTQLLTNEVTKENAITNQMRCLLDNLKALNYLRTTYNCKITLADYSQNDKKEVCYNLLTWIDEANDIAKFVPEFLQPFVRQNILNLDEILHDYVQEVFEREKFDWWHWEEAPWVKQIIAVIGCIQNTEFLLKSVVCVLNCAPVPWCSEVEELANNCLDLKHAMVSEVKTEMERVVFKVVLMKYGLQKYDIHDSNMALTVINHIIVQDKESVMEDALTIINFFPRITDIDVYTCRMRHLTSSEKFEEVFTLIKSLQSSVAIRCCKRFAIYVQQLLGSGLSFLTEQKESFLFVKAAIYALEYLKKHMDSFDFEEYEELFDQLRRIRTLQVEFGSFITICDLNSSEQCGLMFRKNVESFLSNGKFLCNLDESVLALLECNEKKVGGMSETHSRLYRLADVLGLKQGSALKVVSKLAFEQNHNDVLLDILRDVCHEKMDRDFAATSLSLVKYFIEHIHEKVDTTNTTFLSHFVIILGEMLSSVAIYCDPKLLESCAELSPLVSMLKEVHFHSSEPDLESYEGVMLGHFDPYEQWVFSPIYKENVLPVDAEVVLVSISSMIKQLSTVLLMSNREPNILASVSAVISNGQVLIRQLCQKGHISMAYRILISVVTVFSSHGLMLEKSSMMDKVNDIKRKLANSMITVAFGQRHLDKSMLLGLLLSLDHEEACNILLALQKRCGFNYDKLKALAEVGCCFASLYDVPDDVQTFKVLLSEADWGQRLTKLQISYKAGFQTSSREKMKLVQEICRHPKVTVSLLKEYCETFALDTDRAFCNMLETLLTTVARESNAVEQSSYCRKRQTNVFQFKMCSQAINEVQSELFILNTLQSVFEKMDSYNYEILSFVLENIQLTAISLSDHEAITFSEKGIAVLDFLKHYKRVEKPTDFEVDLWLEKNSEARNIDMYVNKRLPFHVLMGSDFWKIISSELTISTIDVWLKLAPLFVGTKHEETNGLEDNMIVAVVQNLIPQPTTRSKAREMHNCDEFTYDLVETLFDLISRIHNPAKQLATASFIINRLPPSEIKVSAAQNAIDLARKWFEETQDKKAERAVTVFVNQCTEISSEYVLRTHGLENPFYLSLCNDPYKLIVELYNDPSIVDRYWFHSAKYPDIHKACKDIARNNKCDMDEIFFSLLEKWVAPKECTAVGLDDTISMEGFSPRVTNVSLESNFSVDDDNLKRAIYLMKLGSDQENASHVAKWVFSDTSGVSQGLKFRAGLCLIHTSVNAIEDCTKMTISQVKNLVKLLFCASQLENLHLPCESTTLRNQSEVKDVVVQLLQTSRYNPKAVELAADLSLKAKLSVPKIWSTILQQMIDLKMCEQLSRSLILIPSNAQIAWLPVVSKAWDYVLRASVSNRNKDKIVLFNSCPSLKEMDLVSLSHSFKEMNLLVLALDCFIHIIDPIAKERHIKNFFTVSIVQRFLKQLKELQVEYHNMFHLDKIVTVAVGHISASESICNSLTSDEMDFIVNNTQ